MELPRLTGSLRAFSELSPGHTFTPTGDDLSKKRKQRSKSKAGEDLSWTGICDVVMKYAEVDKSEAMGQLKQLFSLGNDIG